MWSLPEKIQIDIMCMYHWLKCILFLKKLKAFSTRGETRHNQLPPEKAKKIPLPSFSFRSSTPYCIFFITCSIEKQRLNGAPLVRFDNHHSTLQLCKTICTYIMYIVYVKYILITCIYIFIHIYAYIMLHMFNIHL